MSLQPSKPLRALWDAIPSTNCKGLCAASCGPIGCGPEEERLLSSRGVHLPDVIEVLEDVAAGGEPPTCPALDHGRCSVYDVRPTVCHLWGVVEGMPCPWGCEPDGGLIPEQKGRLLMAASAALR